MSGFTHIIVHCSASAWGCAREIRQWHIDPKRKGGPFNDIGYQFVIGNGSPRPDLTLLSLDGQIECGRYLDGDNIVEENEVGAHALGYNRTSIGICLIGKPFTVAQFDSLKALVLDLCRKFDIKPDNILGHCETESGKAEGKTCPDFDVAAIRMWAKGRI